MDIQLKCPFPAGKHKFSVAAERSAEGELFCGWLEGDLSFLLVFNRHKAFVDMVREGLSKNGKEGVPRGSGKGGSGSFSDRGSGKLPADLPVYKADDKL